MRPPRIFHPVNSSVINAHLISRALDRTMIFDDVAKEKFRQLLAQQLAFSQIELVTFCIMGNHWHLLVSLDTAQPNPLQDAPDDAFLDHLSLIYSDTEVQKIGWQLASYRAGNFEESAAKLRQKYLDRMRDIPHFVKELKQRFSRWHNRRSKRKGTVWEDRYKSVQVEDNETAMRTMAAYIDLNPVRAGVVQDPKDYRWSGYGEAVAGVASSRAGLTHLVKTECGDDSETATWDQIQAIYRCWLYEEGQEVRSDDGQVIRRGFSPQTSEMVINRQQGAIARSVLVKARVRHFTEGMAIGGKAFLEAIFQARRNVFPPDRIDGARKIQGVRWGGLMTMRDLRG
jgi:REP element-mobilizing transposase RayT